MTQPPIDEGTTDGELLARIAARDDTALGALYDRYSGLALGLAYKVLRDRGQAEDVVQEAFLSVWRRAATLTSCSSTGAARTSGSWPSASAIRCGTPASSSATASAR